MSKLGDFATFEMGQAPPGSECNGEGVGTLFVKAGEFGLTYPVQREWTTKPLKFGRTGDVFICVVGATAGKLNLGIDCAIGRSVAAIRPSPDLVTKYLYYQLQPWVLKLRAASAGSAQGVISKKQLAEIPIYVPDLDEQHRIVAEIEQQFSRLDEAIANLQRVKANLKRYKASVLKAAVEGRLVETEASIAQREGRSYETGEQLLQRILEERRARWKERGKFSEPDAPVAKETFPFPAGWCISAIPQIAAIASGNTPAGILDLVKPEGDVPWFKVGDMNHLSNQHSMSHADAWLTHQQVDNLGLRVFPPQTVIFPKRGGAIATNKKRLLSSCGACDLNVMGITPFDGVAPYFFLWFEGIDLAKLSDGSNVPQINNKDISPLTVPLPPIAEQTRIVAEVDRHLSIMREVEAEVDASLHRSQALRQATLQRAFAQG